MLQIAVHRDGGVAARQMQPAGQRGFLAEIARHAHDLDALVKLAFMHQRGEGRVAAAVVDADDFVLEIKPAQDGIQPLEKLRTPPASLWKGRMMERSGIRLPLLNLLTAGELQKGSALKSFAFFAFAFDFALAADGFGFFARLAFGGFFISCAVSFRGKRLRVAIFSSAREAPGQHCCHERELARIIPPGGYELLWIKRPVGRQTACGTHGDNTIGKAGQ